MERVLRGKARSWLGAVPRPLWVAAAIVGLYAVAALPLLPISITRSADGPLHLYRLVELDHSLAQGALFPRWTPDLVQGYGFRLFNHYPPLAYYVAELWQLLGLSLARSLSLTLRLYWQARQSMEQEYTVFTHLLDATDHISAQQDSVPTRGARPTTGWVQGEIIVDEHELVVRDDAPTGAHQVEIGMYEAASGQRLPVTDRAGQPLGDRLLLDTIQVH